MTLLEELKDKMKHGCVHFTYMKKDGTERKAFGTRYGIIIEEKGGEEALGHGWDGSGIVRIHEGATAYYDVEKLAWRSFRDDSLISIDD